MEIFEKEKINSLKEQVKEYVQTQIDIALLKVVRGGSQAAGNIVLFVLLALFTFFLILFLSLAGAIAISSWLDNRISGFLIVGGFYLLLSIVFLVFKSQLVIRPLSNAMINAVLNKGKEDEKDQKS